MDVTSILSQIDAEISRLQQARAALVAIGGSGAVAATRRRGRPKGSTNAAKSATTTAATKSSAPKRKRNLSPEGRKRIADAMKKRWADRRKAAAKTAAK